MTWDRESDSCWKTYRLFDLTLRSDFYFESRLLPGHGPTDVAFASVSRSPGGIEVEDLAPVYASWEQTGSGRSKAYLYSLDACDVVRLTDEADFYLFSDRILCQAADSFADQLVEIRFLGPVLALWLERQGIPTLHAAAVTDNCRTAAFLSGNYAGKSSLAAAFVQAGYALLTDDMLAIERHSGTFWGRPGYPQMRLWPDEARHFVGHKELEQIYPGCSKRRVPIGLGGFGSFSEKSQPLSCIYLPERRSSAGNGSDITISPVPPRFAAMELIRHTFTPRLVEALGLQPLRLAQFSALIDAVPVRRISYPGGFDLLPRVRDMILADLEKLPG